MCRQIVSHKEGRWINGTLYGIGRGAPEDPANNPQGGFVPESMVILPDGLIVGSRRNKRYSCSNDFGENWYEIDNLPTSLYQPFMLLLPNGQIANFGHLGGDCAFGQADMYIGADIFRVENQMPPAGRLLLKRDFSENGDRYINQYTASFLLGDKPITGEKLTFRFNPVWKDGHLYNVVPQEEAPVVKYAVTDEKGQATVTAEEFDHCGDIHYSYTADVIYRPGAEGRCRACDGPRMVQYGMTPVRRCRYPYDAYFAEGALYLSPLLLQEYPDLIERISPLCGEPEGRLEEKVLPEAVIERFLACGVLVREDGALFWRKSVHAPVPLNRVLSMAEGDWYE